MMAALVYSMWRGMARRTSFDAVDEAEGRSESQEPMGSRRGGTGGGVQIDGVWRGVEGDNEVMCWNIHARDSKACSVKSILVRRRLTGKK